MRNFQALLHRIGTKILLLIVLVSFIHSCNSTKEIQPSKPLLGSNKVFVDEKLNSIEEVNEIPNPKPNSKVLGFRFWLAIHNLSRKNPDSSYQAWLNRKPGRKKFLESILSKKQTERLGQSFMVSGWSKFLKEIGEKPSLMDSAKMVTSKKRLKSYYFRKGYFNAQVSSQVVQHKNNKIVNVEYKVNTGKRYFIDSLVTKIESSTLVPLYEESSAKTKIKKGDPYLSESLEEERDRISQWFRNNGVYHFQTNNVTYTIDTLNTGHKANINLIIKDRLVTSGDTSVTKPFQIYKISRINVFTEDPLTEKATQVIDSAQYNDIHFYSYGKLRYRPKAIADAIFFNQDALYSDNNRTLTTRSLSNLRVFQYPNIQFLENKDSINHTLTANIFLSPRDKYSFQTSFNVIRSNIQDFGIIYNASIGVRNLFRGAETLELAGRGNLGSSKDLANYDTRFFNLSEYGADLKLNVPRFLAPFGTRKWMPKRMIPSTLFSLGFSIQQNIGLDKQNLLGNISYKWDPKSDLSVKFDLLNVQYVRNVNVSNYFNVYGSSYTRLNQIAQLYAADENLKPFFDSNNKLIIDSGTNGFISEVLNNSSVVVTDSDYTEIRRINERKTRLTENNLITASNIQITKNTQKDVFDNNFYIFKTKIESAGLLMSVLSSVIPKNQGISQGRTFYDVAYSQYGKVEVEYIKHWDLKTKSSIATRIFLGIAIPYGNSNNIPFSRSYFGGGANDNRAWQPYRLGPGRSGSLNDFNEANFKLAMNLEYRFGIYNKFKGALFIDAGNIWNIYDYVKDIRYTFNGVKSLQDVAVGSGFGLRYDLSFFVLRLDIGFKNYDPAKEIQDRWRNKYNFASSVINIGINYPF